MKPNRDTVWRNALEGKALAAPQGKLRVGFPLLVTLAVAMSGLSYLSGFRGGDGAHALGESVVPASSAVPYSNQNALLESCIRNYDQKYHDYTGRLVKQERLGGVVGKEQELTFKFRQSPYSVAMAWLRDPVGGDRVLYVQGKYDDKMLVRPLEILRALNPTLEVKPDSPEARKSTLFPVDHFGFKRIMEDVIQTNNQAKQAGDFREEPPQSVVVDGKPCIRLVRYLTEKKADYPAYKTVIYIDREYMVPTLIEGTGWGGDNDFLWRYSFSDLKFDVGLEDADFTPEANDLVTPRK